MAGRIAAVLPCTARAIAILRSRNFRSPAMSASSVTLQAAGAWNNSGTWTPATVPGAATDVTLASIAGGAFTVSVTGAQAGANLTEQPTGFNGTLAIETGGSLTLSSVNLGSGTSDAGTLVVSSGGVLDVTNASG